MNMTGYSRTWMLLAAMVLVSLNPLPLMAGNLLAPASPTSPESATYTLQDVLQRMQTGANGAKRTGSFASPPDGPIQATMPNTAAILAMLPVPEPAAAASHEVAPDLAYWSIAASSWGGATGAPALLPPRQGVAMPAGYYAETVWPEQFVRLRSWNIADGVEIFGVTGTALPSDGGALAPVIKTGQTNAAFRTGDDGDLQKGVAWPVPRYEIVPDATNCVRDRLTGLVWVRRPADFFPSGLTFSNAVTAAASLTGAEGFGPWEDWRIPNAEEMLSLVDYGRPDGFNDNVFVHPNRALVHWTSTMYRDSKVFWQVRFSSPPEFRWSPFAYEFSLSGIDYILDARLWPVAGPFP